MGKLIPIIVAQLEQIVAAGDRDFDRPLDVPLPLYIAEIDLVIFVRGEKRIEIAVSR